MSLQTLSPPQDVTWQRMAYSRDMVDTSFGDMVFPPKWRTSMAIYYYIVPEEDTADSYPNAKIVYLKFTCSITGWNPNEDLIIAHTDVSGDTADDLQNSIWEQIFASGWATKYWGCYGAIMQIGIYPGKTDTVGPDDYPYIMDFEPKKRELYEQATEGGESLSGSSDKISTTKGTTNTQSVEVSAGASYGVVSASAKLGASWQQVDNNTTDTSKEKRETLSHSSSFSQLYQLFNGYHLGTNRAVFSVAPRPHTVNSPFNLINGERMLEGIQEVFLVIQMPKSLKGFCVQASIDTGHKNPDESADDTSMARTFMVTRGDISDPPCMGGTIGNPGGGTVGGGGGGGGGVGGGSGGGSGTGGDTGSDFVVTRRIIQSCGIFDDNGNLVIQPTGAKPKPPRPVLVSGEVFLPTKGAVMMRTREAGAPDGGFDDCYDDTAFMYNYNLSRMSKKMVDIFSAGGSTLKEFQETNTFKKLFGLTAKNTSLSLDELLKMKYITQKEYDSLKKYKVESIGDIFKDTTENITDVSIDSIRKKIVNPGKKS